MSDDIRPHAVYDTLKSFKKMAGSNVIVACAIPCKIRYSYGKFNCKVVLLLLHLHRIFYSSGSYPTKGKQGQIQDFGKGGGVRVTVKY